MENMQCSDALVELTDLNRSIQCTPGTTTISSSSSIGSNRPNLHKYHSHFTCQGTGISSSAVVVHQHVKVSANHRFITKILNSPRKAYEMPLCRMRPYFIPERSRTKSESLDTSSSAVSTTYSEVESSGDNEFPPNQSPYTTSTTNSATYSMVAATQMDTTNTNRSGLIQTQCNPYEDAPRKHRQRKWQTLKKSRSMEDVRAKAEGLLDGSQLSHEMEFVSSRIQKLKVQE